MPAPEALSREKRQAILDGAGRVFARSGYEGASMAAITAEAGVSKGTIYHHFTGKADLFGAYVAEQCEQNLLPLFREPGLGQDTAVTLRDIGLRFVRMVTSPAGIVIDRVVISEAARFPELARAFYEAGPERGLAALARWLDVQVGQGRLAIDDTAFAAEQFFSLCHHPVTFRRKLGIVAGIDDRQMERVVDAAVVMFLKAYAPCAHGRPSSCR